MAAQDISMKNHRRSGVRWIMAAVALIPLAVILLIAGLILPSLLLVYLSIACSLAWLPLLIFGVVEIIRARRSPAPPASSRSV